MREAVADALQRYDSLMPAAATTAASQPKRATFSIGTPSALVATSSSSPHTASPATTTTAATAATPPSRTNDAKVAAIQQRLGKRTEERKKMRDYVAHARQKAGGSPSVSANGSFATPKLASNASPAVSDSSVVIERTSATPASAATSDTPEIMIFVASKTRAVPSIVATPIASTPSSDLVRGRSHDAHHTHHQDHRSPSPSPPRHRGRSQPWSLGAGSDDDDDTRELHRNHSEPNDGSDTNSINGGAIDNDNDDDADAVNDHAGSEFDLLADPDDDNDDDDDDDSLLFGSHALEGIKHPPAHAPPPPLLASSAVTKSLQATQDLLSGLEEVNRRLDNLCVCLPPSSACRVPCRCCCIH